MRDPFDGVVMSFARGSGSPSRRYTSGGRTADASLRHPGLGYSRDVATDAHLRGARSGDAAIVAALRAHDETVFARLVEDWSPGMLRLARAHVSTLASAEEVVQEAW